MTLPLKQDRSIKIHFFYVTLILSLAIICLATNYWTNLEGFPEYLSVAATFTSLFLGILAIIYSFVSTGTMNQFFGSIQNSTTAMNGVAIEMRDALIKGQNLQTQAETRTNELHSLAESLTTSLSSLEESTRNISGKVDSIPTQISAMQEALISSSLATPTDGTSVDIKSLWTQEQTASALARTTGYGLIALKAISMAKEQDLYIDIAKIDSDVYLYGYGYLLALQATGLIKLEYPKTKNKMHAVRLSSGAENIQNLIDAEWESRKSKNKISAYMEQREALLQSALHDGNSTPASDV